MAMLTLDGYLKQKEHLSARLGDVLSSLYMASMVLKHYENQGRPEADLPLVEWSCRTLLYKAQEQLHDFLRNFPNRFIAAAMRLAWGIYRTVEPGNALDLPGQIEQALAAGLINAAEAAQLREFDRKVMAIIDVDDFTHEELQAAVQAEPKPAGVTRLSVA